MKKITTFILACILAVCLFACDSCKDNAKEKPNPFISNPDSILASIKETVGTITYTYEVKNGALYLSLKKDVGNSILVNIVDRFLLDSYYQEVKNDQDLIKETIDKDVFGDEEEREELTEEEKEEKIQEFLDTMFVSYGCVETSIYAESIQAHYILSLAQKAYAREIIKQEYQEHMDAYLAYEDLTDEEKVEAVEKALENEEELITTPYFTESQYASKYNAENYTVYNVIVVPFDSARNANIALQAINVKVNSDGLWTDESDNLLTPTQVRSKYIELYEYYYGLSNLTYESEEFVLKASELSIINSNILTRVKDKMTSFSNDVSNNKDQTWYYGNPYITSGGGMYAYVLKLGETLVDTYDDLTDAKKEEVKELYLDELLEDNLSNNYVLAAMAKLREDKNFIIYDTVIELAYIKSVASFDVEYEKTELESKTLVAKIDGFEVSADMLYQEMLKDYGLSSIGDELAKQRFLVNTTLNKYYNLTTKAWLDKDVQDEIEEILDSEKKNFEDGVYADNGYTRKNCTWTTFMESVYGVNNESDLKIAFLSEVIAKDYKEKLNYIGHFTGKDENSYVYDMSLEDALESPLWLEIQKAMENEVNKYFSVKGIHLLICSYEDPTQEANGSVTDPSTWSTEKQEKALELYQEVIAYLNDTKGTYQEKFTNIVKAFKYAPSKDGNFTYLGDPVNTVLKGDTTSQIQVSLYKSYGLYVKFEDLGTFTNGQMVEEFNDAVKAIWDADRSERKSDKITLADDVIKTKFGYHVYVNLGSNELSYIETYKKTVPDLDEEGNEQLDDEGNVKTKQVDAYRYLPTLEEIRTYLLNNTTSSLTTSKKTAITKYYTPIASEITGENFTYAARFNQLKSLASTFTNDTYTTEDFVRYCELYVEFTMEQYMSRVTDEFLDIYK